MDVTVTSFVIFAACLFAMQCLLHPVWAGVGEAIAASSVAGTRHERVLMVALAVLTVASVAWVMVPR